MTFCYFLMITSYRETDTFSQLEWILMRIQVKTWCILSEGFVCFFFLPREKTETIVKMNLLSLFCYQEICRSPHLLYFFVWKHWEHEPSLSLKERSLKIKYGVCAPTKPDKLILLSWYNFRGHKGHTPKPVKIDRISANLSAIWTRLEVKPITEYIITSYFVLLQNITLHWLSCIMRLLLWNTAGGLILSLWWSKLANTCFLSVSKTRLCL